MSTQAVHDPTHERWLLPSQPLEESLDRDPNTIVTRRRVFVDAKAPFPRDKAVASEDVALVAWELDKFATDSWIYYKTWEYKAEKLGGSSGPKNADVLLVHGYREYTGQCAYMARYLLEAGYRVILLDLPGHGRSTGLHGHIEHPSLLTSAIKVVFQDHHDQSANTKQPSRKAFVCGSCIGGTAALSFTLDYPGYFEGDGIGGIRVEGVYALCPLIDSFYGPSKLQIPFIKLAGRYASKRPLNSLTKGLHYWDDRYEEVWSRDPLMYNGKMRAGTAASLVKAYKQLQKRIKEVKAPLCVVHGQYDRLTDWSASTRWAQNVSCQDKSDKLYPNVHHVMVVTFENNMGSEERYWNDTIMGDWIRWLDDRC